MGCGCVAVLAAVFLTGIGGYFAYTKMAEHFTMDATRVQKIAVEVCPQAVTPTNYKPAMAIMLDKLKFAFYSGPSGKDDHMLAVANFEADNKDERVTYEGVLAEFEKENGGGNNKRKKVLKKSRIQVKFLDTEIPVEKRLVEEGTKKSWEYLGLGLGENKKFLLVMGTAPAGDEDETFYREFAAKIHIEAFPEK